MNSKIHTILVVLVSLLLCGCETLKGVTQDVANTARNVGDIFRAGKTIHDTTQ